MTDEAQPIDRMHGPRRGEIVRAGTTVFAELGFAGASVRAVAAQAGIEKGHLTYYFRTKEELLFEIIKDLHERFLASLMEWSSAPLEGDALLRHVFASHVRFIMDAADATRVAYDSFRFLTGTRRDDVLVDRRRYETVLGELIDDAREVTAIADVSTPVLTKVVLAQLNWPYLWYSPGGKTPPEELAATLATRAVASLKPLDPPDSSGLTWTSRRRRAGPRR